MSYHNTSWIWQQDEWPNFYWKDAQIQPLLRRVHVQQGMLLGKMDAIHDDRVIESELDNLLQSLITSFAIEGEQFNIQSVRSSLAKRIGLNLKQAYPVSDRSEGIAQMMLDAIGNLDAPLSLERLFQWHRWLFPIQVGQLRGEEPMQVVSGRIDKPTIHFEAPPRESLDSELKKFIDWFQTSKNDKTLDPFVRAAISHFWFVTLHPFEDGNGRITRVLTDLALAQNDKKSIRLYAMSVAILEKRQEYYRILEQSQRNHLDITLWIEWFLGILDISLKLAIHKIDRTLIKTRFWQIYHGVVEFSPEQIKIINRLLDGGEKGFEQGISAAQYQKVAKVSKATATRHLTDLLAKGCIEKLPGGGRNTRYCIKNKSF